MASLEDPARGIDASVECYITIMQMLRFVLLSALAFVSSGCDGADCPEQSLAMHVEGNCFFAVIPLDDCEIDFPDSPPNEHTACRQQCCTQVVVKPRLGVATATCRMYVQFTDNTFS